MKIETVKKLVDADKGMPPLMKKLWYSRVDTDGYSEELLKECVEELKKLSDEDLLTHFYTIAYLDVTERGVKNDSCINYFFHVMRPLLEQPEAQKAILKILRGE